MSMRAVRIKLMPKNVVRDKAVVSIIEVVQEWNVVGESLQHVSVTVFTGASYCS